MHSVSTPPENVRHDWIDMGKGVCMVLVVLLHVSHWFEGDIGQGASGPWLNISEILTPLRMPLFFLISGYLAARALTRPLSSTKRKTIGLFYLYVLWTAASCARRWILSLTGSTEPPTAVDILSSIVLPTLYWYIWALAIFFLITWALKRLLGSRSGYALAPLLALSAVSPFIKDWAFTFLQPRMDPIELGSVAANLVWFYLGVHAKEQWSTTMEAATKWKLIMSIGLYALMYAAAASFDLVEETKIILAPVALLAAAQALAVCKTKTRGARILRKVGESTLPVYILHFFAISALSVLLDVSGLASVLRDRSEIELLILLPAVTVAVVYSTIVLGRLIMASPVRWLLVAPKGLVEAKSANRS